MTPGDDASGSDLPSLYKRKLIIVWVEDELTRVWLRELWKDPDLEFLVGGGGRAVRAIVDEARRSGHFNVFGVRDRDFGASNVDGWANPDTSVFVPSAHEVENYLLDFNGIASLGRDLNPRGLDASTLREQAHHTASRSVWWLAATAVIADVKAMLPGGVIGRDPRREDAETRDAALVALGEQLSATKLREANERAQAAFEQASLAQRLDEHHNRLHAQLAGDDWMSNWPGKELAKSVAMRLQAEQRPRSVGVVLNDVARGLASWQRQLDRRNPELVQLYEELRSRVRLTTGR